jgi:tetratricopeptide (TPR) repeat protein
MTGRLVRQVLLGAATQGLDVAGLALVGPAWPVLRGALAPVLARLSEQLGGADPVSSPEAAAQAADIFEQDQRLGELLRSNLGEALQPVLAAQQRLDTGFRTLSLLVLEDRQSLQDIKDRLGSLEATIAAEGKLSDDADELLVGGVARQAAVSREVREFARDEAQSANAVLASPEAWMTREELVAEVSDAEVEAVRQLQEGRVDGAFETLRDARGMLWQALEETPSDICLRLLSGYLFKATAQAVADDRGKAAAVGWLQRAETIFQLIIRDLPSDPETRGEIASAVNGLANILAERGRHREAVTLYREALRLEPTYGYAWHDLFGSLDALAADGDLRPSDLDAAWNGLVANAAGYAKLDPAYLEELRVKYEHWRPNAARTIRFAEESP